MKNILLTGGAGFIGSHILDRLIANEYNLILLEHSSADFWRITKHLKNISIFFSDKDSLSTIFEKFEIEAIIHLATYYKKYHHPSDIEKIFFVNNILPTQLLEFAIAAKVKYFINTGTFFEYKRTITPITETTEYSAFNLYAQSKINFENILKFYADKIKSVTFKIFSPFGPKDDTNKIIPALIKALLKNQKIKLSAGYQKLDFIFVKDIAAAYCKLLENIDELYENFNIFNIASGVSYSIREIVEILENISNKKIDIEWGVTSENENNNIIADITKIRQFLKWSPEYNIKDGLAETLNYYKQNI